jgi:uncharacterized protein YdeI (BOF family)
MPRTFSAVISYLSLSILVMMLFAMAIGINNNNHTDYKAFAATNASVSSIPKAKQDTFSAIGTISSLVITVPTKSADGFNITNAFKVILTGEWNLSVRKGNVTNFAANFLASPMDGSKPHIHQITNFQKANTTRQQQQTTQVAPDNSVSINGTVDVKINGVVVWHNANVSIQILKGNTIAIRLNDKDTEDHFGAQPVLGVVNRLIV